MSGNHEDRKRRPAGVTWGGNGELAAVRDSVEDGAKQTASDADQTASDADQTASDADQISSDRDQTQSDTDQRASDRDQAAADRDLSAHPGIDVVGQRAYETSRVERKEGTSERVASAVIRSHAASDRDRQAAQRDETANLRDRAAEFRDQVDQACDRKAATLAQELGTTHDLSRAAIVDAAAARTRAAEARVRAAADRERAASDRRHAAEDRRRAQAELEHAHLDDLTGAYRRGLGEVALRHEIERAQRSNGSLVLAFVDVDGLKDVNDRDGHAAGDAVLIRVSKAIRAKLRPYDPLVRSGGDEFICTMSNADLDGARRRFEQVRLDLNSKNGGTSMSVGLVAVRPDETLEGLMARGDAALYEAKHTR